MAKKKKPLPLLERIKITAVAAEGKALARVDDLVVFVPFVVPGDVVDLQVRRKKHSYAEAEAVKFTNILQRELFHSANIMVFVVDANGSVCNMNTSLSINNNK